MIEDAFLQAIRASPDDDAPRLIYADWLEETGRGPRAEFIRVQVALARHPSLREREELEAREKVLLETHRAAWLAELPRLEGVEWISFSRGFVDSARFATAEAFVTHAEAAFAAAPIQEAYFRSLLPETVEKMMRSSLFRRLRTVVAAHQGLANVGVLALVSSRYLAGLFELLIPGNHIGDEGALAVADSPHLGRLKILDLRDNDLTDAGVRFLAASPNLAGLESLLLVNNEIRDPGLTALAESPHLRHLEHLYLNHNWIGSAGVVSLASSPLLGRLVELDLRDNVITDEGALALAASPHAEHLHELLLTNNDVGSAGVEALRARFGRRVRV